jgi:cell division protein FtsW (lipid II flippase)
MRIAAVILLLIALGCAYTILFITAPTKVAEEAKLDQIRNDLPTVFKTVSIWLMTDRDPEQEQIDKINSLARLNRGLIFGTVASGCLSIYLFRKPNKKTGVGFARDF